MAETLTPATPDELRAIVQAAIAEETPLEIVGRGSKRALGRPLVGLHTLSTAGLSGILFHEPEELVLSARAGTPIAAIETALDETRQQLAFEPADYAAILGGEPGQGTIGGVFACNLTGPRRIKAGAARDHLLGLRCVTGRGDAIMTGGRVVKNVTGYDLCKLSTGAFGTLAVMSEVTFKVMPAPEETATVVGRGRGRAALSRILRDAMATPCEVAGAALLPEAAAARSTTADIATAGGDLALVRLEGHGPSVAYRAESITKLMAAAGAEVETLARGPSLALWREIRDAALLPNDAVLWRISLPPAAADAFAETIAPLGAELVFDWAGGLIWAALPDVPEDAAAATIRTALAASGGHAGLIRAPAEIRSRVPVFQPQPDALAGLTRRVKDSFDPGRILNPGRMYDGV